jgi:hypothetical protein
MRDMGAARKIERLKKKKKKKKKKQVWQKWNRCIVWFNRKIKKMAECRE